MWPKTNTVNDIRKYIIKSLNKSFPNEHECNMFARILLSHITGFNNSQLLLKQDLLINESDLVWLKKSLAKINKHYPIQYIVGYEYFMDLKIEVNKNTLIPRPETEELVNWILTDFSDNQKSLLLLDIGTGSGCIAVAIKANRLKWTVSGIDYNKETLKKAKSNAEKLNLDIDFQVNDILNYSFTKVKYDIIVSNPPYICEHEKAKMHENVLNFEPHSALFVPDDNPLIFYKNIAQIATKSLKDNGVLYLEINESLGNETIELLKNSGFSIIELRKDLFGKDRMIKAEI